MKRILIALALVAMGCSAKAQDIVKETVVFRDTLKMDVYTRADVPVDSPRPAFI